MWTYIRIRSEHRAGPCGGYLFRYWQCREAISRQYPWEPWLLDDRRTSVVEASAMQWARVLVIDMHPHGFMYLLSSFPSCNIHALDAVLTDGTWCSMQHCTLVVSLLSVFISLARSSQRSALSSAATCRAISRSCICLCQSEAVELHRCGSCYCMSRSAGRQTCSLPCLWPSTHQSRFISLAMENLVET